MRLLLNGIVLIFNRFVLHMSNGKALRIFVEKMGLAYIKLAQILAMQNIGEVFTESDRQDLLHICDDCNQISFRIINKTLRTEYGDRYKAIIKKIKRKQVGSASVSQVHYGVLQSGEKVVFKVKRKDIDKTVRKDVHNIRFIMKHFGWIVGFKNVRGGNKALDFYIDWILQELDFEREVRNIARYQEFADSVNGKVNDCKQIVLPKVYKEYCTPNVICMEYIEYKTISNLPTGDINIDNKIIKAAESYIKLSFYALLHDMPVVFHGDPHAGNIYIDNNGNIGFLDMGLIFELSPKDAKRTKDLFFMAYFQQNKRLFNTLEPGLRGSRDQIDGFRNEVDLYCRRIPTMPVTNYFMDLIVVCMKYDICPDDFLFCMAKAFVCLNGIDVFCNNETSGRDMLMTQVIDYVVHRTAQNSVKLLMNTIRGEFALATFNKDKLYNAIQDNINIILDVVT